jgi:DNA-binding NtrC family response regulator
MTSLSTRPAGVHGNSAHDSPTLQRHVRALVVSPELEVRKPLLRTLEELRVDTLVCSGRAQAEEVLSKQPVEIVFCDERLPDGCYSDLIRQNPAQYRVPRVVVTTRTGDWDLYFEALRKGAFDVIRCPYCATDVEMTVIRAVREEHGQSWSHDAAE